VKRDARRRRREPSDGRRLSIRAGDGAEFANSEGGYERYVGDGGETGEEEERATDPSSSTRTETYDQEFSRLLSSRKALNEAETKKRWNEGAATPKVAFDLGTDYIRRVAVKYPYAVVGSAKGDVAVSDVSKASALAISPSAHEKNWVDAEERPLGERVLLGAHDGGAVTSVALSLMKEGKHDFAKVASGGRDGVVRLYEACSNSAALREIGRAQHEDVVTGLTFARDSLWSVALDGKLCRWALNAKEDEKIRNAKKLWGRKQCEEYTPEPSSALLQQGEWRSGQPTLCMSSDDDAGLISIGNADGSAAILSADSSSFGETSVINAWIAHEGSTVRSIAHCPGNGIITGSSDGVIRVWRLISDGIRDATFDSLASRRVNHNGVTPRLVAELRGHTAAVVSLSAGCPGRLVSGAHDGTIRVWDLDLTSTKPGQRIKTIRRDARYAVLGHTIWLGGVYADAERIVCDGANNVLLEYDFTATADDDDDDADKGDRKTR